MLYYYTHRYMYNIYIYILYGVSSTSKLSACGLYWVHIFCILQNIYSLRGVEKKRKSYIVLIMNKFSRVILIKKKKMKISFRILWSYICQTFHNNIQLIINTRDDTLWLRRGTSGESMMRMCRWLIVNICVLKN